MKRIAFFIILLIMFALQSALILACPACEKQQPAAFTGITHGAPPEGAWEYAIVGIIAVITLFVAVKSIQAVRHTALDAECLSSHIKHTVLE